MKYDLVGIDTIRFDVPQQGFRSWLKKHDFRKIKVEATPLTSRTLQRKVEIDTSIRVVKINSSYPNKLSNYIVVGKAKKKRYYTIEIAGFLVRARRKPQRYPRYREDLQRCHGRKDAVSSAE